MNDDVSVATGSGASAWLGSLGASASIACAIQCSLIPLLIGILPILGLGFLLGEEAEGYFLIAALVLAITVFAAGVRPYGRFHILFFFAGAAGLMYAGRQWAGPELELPLVVSGSLLLASGHLVNRRLCRSCAHCRVSELSQT